MRWGEPPAPGHRYAWRLAKRRVGRSLPPRWSAKLGTGSAVGSRICLLWGQEAGAGRWPVLGSEHPVTCMSPGKG